MIVIPAVDIKDGKCVQLVGGEPGTETYYGDPVKVAKLWQEQGAQLLHVIDLDAALGSGSNLELVKKIKEAVKIPVQFGGGIRTEAKARKVLEAGVDRIIIGTLAIKEPKVIKALTKDYPNSRLMVALDSRDGKVVVKGWKEKTEIPTARLIRRFRRSVFGFLVTDLDSEGKMEGIDLKEFAALTSQTDAKIIASGGISSAEDIEALRRIGAYGCVIGKALYEGKLNPGLLRQTI